MAQASSNCLYLSKCGITKGYLLQSKGAIQLAQKPLKKSNSYKVLLTSEAVKFGQIPKLPMNAFITKVNIILIPLFLDLNNFFLSATYNEQF